MKKRAIFVIMMAMILVISGFSTLGVQASTKRGETKPTLELLYSQLYYGEHNPDVLAFYAGDAAGMLRHYLTDGTAEGRDTNPIINVREYRAGNKDLDEAFGDDWAQYPWQFVTDGIWEIAEGKRSMAGLKFDATIYLQEHPALYAKVGNDLLAAVQDYIANGMPKGNWVISPKVAAQEAVSTAEDSQEYVGGSDTAEVEATHESSGSERYQETEDNTHQESDKSHGSSGRPNVAPGGNSGNGGSTTGPAVNPGNSESEDKDVPNNPDAGDNSDKDDSENGTGDSNANHGTTDTGNGTGNPDNPGGDGTNGGGADENAGNQDGSGGVDADEAYNSAMEMMYQKTCPHPSQYGGVCTQCGKFVG